MKKKATPPSVPEMRAALKKEKEERGKRALRRLHQLEAEEKVSFIPWTRTRGDGTVEAGIDVRVLDREAS